MDTAWSAIIVASLSFLASVVTASLSYAFTKRNQILNDARRIKEEFYRQFVKALSDIAINNSDTKAQTLFSESINTLLLIGSPGVVRSLMEFHNHVRSENTTIPRESNEWLELHNHLLGELYKELRLDLFGHRSINKNFPKIHLVRRGPRK